MWQEKLSRVELDVANTPPNVTEMFYSSFYRSFLTPVCSITSITSRRFFSISDTPVEQRYGRSPRGFLKHRVSILRLAILQLGYGTQLSLLTLQLLLTSLSSVLSSHCFHFTRPSSLPKSSRPTLMAGAKLDGCRSAGRTTCLVGHREVSRRLPGLL